MRDCISIKTKEEIWSIQTVTNVAKFFIERGFRRRSRVKRSRQQFSSSNIFVSIDVIYFSSLIRTRWRNDQKSILQSICDVFLTWSVFGMFFRFSWFRWLSKDERCLVRWQVGYFSFDGCFWELIVIGKKELNTCLYLSFFPPFEFFSSYVCAAKNTTITLVRLSLKTRQSE